jgi:HK97 family phage prohead protease
MTISYQSAQFELKREPDQDGVFEGYASVFDIVDQGMDVVANGAFTKSLGSGRRVKMLWQHDQSQPIGVWDEIREDERGLFVRGRVLKDVQKGSEAQALMKAGAIDSLSIGYRTIAAMDEADGRVRKLLEIDLFEISVVTFPMLPDARITDVKSIQTERDFERFLRDAGYSRKQAAALTLHGYKALNDQRDAVVDGEHDQAKAFSQLLEKLNTLQETLHVRGNESRS